MSRRSVRVKNQAYRMAMLFDFDGDVLTDRQKQYAAIDAWACLVLYEELERLKATGNYSLVPDENKSYDL